MKTYCQQCGYDGSYLSTYNIEITITEDDGCIPAGITEGISHNHEMTLCPDCAGWYADEGFIKGNLVYD